MTALSDKKILVVDDERDNVDLIKLVMEFHDVPVVVANSGAGCLELLESEKPNLLLIDIRMPGMTGFQLLEKLRAHELWRTIPVIAVTAQAMEGDRERILAAGFDGYIAKPINALTLVSEVSAILDGRLNGSGHYS